MRNKLLIISLISIFIIIFIIFYKGLQNTNIYSPKTNINNNVPLFSGELLYSKKTLHSSKIFEQKNFYLINIWSSWCVPCRQEHSLLMDLSKYQNIEIIGINYKDTITKAKIFLYELKNPYKKVIFDKDGTVAIEWGAFGVPESFLIRNDKIIKRYIGPLNQESIEEIKLLIK